MAAAQNQRQVAQNQMGVKQAAAQARERLKQEEISRILAQWNEQVQKVVAQVLALRAANPGIGGINAGTNAVGNTQGGNNSPLTFTVQSNDYGLLKCRVSEVLVHLV